MHSLVPAVDDTWLCRVLASSQHTYNTTPCHYKRTHPHIKRRTRKQITRVEPVSVTAGVSYVSHESHGWSQSPNSDCHHSLVSLHSGASTAHALPSHGLDCAVRLYDFQHGADLLIHARVVSHMSAPLSVLGSVWKRPQNADC